MEIDSGFRDHVKSVLGREPTLEELGMFDVMHSEHCSYKSSKKYLKTLPTHNEIVVVGPGQDAGVIDIGEGHCLVFKIESHNHPSYIDPYNGAGTGVGGIIRDILAMGADPVAVMDSIHFGIGSWGKGVKRKHSVSGNSKWLLREVVKGIADYGNSTGIPNIGGEVEFESSFETNCLVNAACLGIMRKEKLFEGSTVNEGDLLVLVGNSTGRDGIQGVSFASKTIDESKDMRPAVQIADPFTKRLIIEALAEIYSKDVVKTVRDFGGGGITSAASEMAHRLEKGLELQLDAIPVREQDMQAYEILLSESQERMLLVVSPDRLKDLEGLLERYTLNYRIIGKVTPKEQGFKAYFNGKLVVDIIPGSLADVSFIDRPVKERITVHSALPKLELKPEQLEETILSVISSPNVCSKRWVYQQYDTQIKGNSLFKPLFTAGVFRVSDSLAVSATCQSNAMLTRLDPYHGTGHVFMEAYRSLVSAFSMPLAFSDNLNYGNPEKPVVMWEFSESLRAMALLGKELNVPCTGGNVSFYNENTANDSPISPAPVVMMVGKLNDLERVAAYHQACSSKDLQAGIYLLRTREPLMSGSEFMEIVTGKPSIYDEDLELDLEKEFAARDMILGCKGILAANDIARGGMIVSLVELLNALGKGAELKIADDGIGRLARELFGQYHGYLVVADPHQIEGILNNGLILKDNMAVSPEQAKGIITKLGSITFQGLTINDQSISLSKLTEAYNNSFDSLLG